MKLGIFIIVGVIFIIAGDVLAIESGLPCLGKLPGDIYLGKDNFSFYLSLTTSIIISLIISLLTYFFG